MPRRSRRDAVPARRPHVRTAQRTRPSGRRQLAAPDDPRRPGQAGAPVDSLEEVHKGVGDPQLEGVLTGPDQVGDLEAVGRPEPHTRALSDDDDLDDVVVKDRLEVSGYA